MVGEINLYDSDGVKQRKIAVDDTSKRVEIRDASGNDIMDIEAHASRHVSGGDDAISGLTYDQLAADTIVIEAPFPVPDSQQSGLAADSTGVKWTSVFKGRWNKRHLKKVRIRATWSASNTDSETKIAVKDVNNNADIVSVSGNAGTDQEAEATDLTNVTDGGLFEIYAEVTTASGTSGATFDISYVVVELVYGVS